LAHDDLRKSGSVYFQTPNMKGDHLSRARPPHRSGQAASGQLVATARLTGKDGAVAELAGICCASGIAGRDG